MTKSLPKQRTGLGRLYSASIFSWQGLRDTYKTEEAFRQETFVGLILIPLSFFVADSAVEWVLLVASYLLVLIVEILNTAVEAVVNRFGSSYHDLAKKAKDAGSAAVFLAIGVAICTWGAIALF